MNWSTHVVCPNCQTTVGHISFEFSSEVYGKPLDSVSWSTRVKHVLFNQLQLEIFGDLCALTASDLLRQPNFGRRSLKEVQDILRSYGLKLTRERWEGGTSS
jgi:DNA-directed RNA polymerase alpha subunit